MSKKKVTEAVNINDVWAETKTHISNTDMQALKDLYNDNRRIVFGLPCVLILCYLFYKHGYNKSGRDAIDCLSRKNS